MPASRLARSSRRFFNPSRSFVPFAALPIAAFLLSCIVGCAINPNRLPAFHDEPRADKTFMYGDIAIRYYEFGEGDPILLLHGFSGAACSWRHIYGPLAETHRVILVDLKGFGLSEKPRDDRYSPDDQAEVIVDFIQENDLRHLTLGGHSFGALIALIANFKLDDKNANPIERMVLIGPPVNRDRIPLAVKILRTPVVNHIGLGMSPNTIVTAIGLRNVFHDDSKITDEMIREYTLLRRLPTIDAFPLPTPKN